jgi:hypothetical protein
MASQLSCGREIEDYFVKKEDAIKSAYRSASNEAAIDGVPAKVLQKWKDSRDSDLANMRIQKADVYEKTGYGPGDEAVVGRERYEFDDSSS